MYKEQNFVPPANFNKKKINGKWKCVGALYILSHFHDYWFGLCPNILFLKSSHWLPVLQNNQVWRKIKMMSNDVKTESTYM